MKKARLLHHAMRDTSEYRPWRRAAVVAAVAASAAALLASAAATAVATRSAAPVWRKPTPAEGKALSVRVGGRLALSLAAVWPGRGARIAISGTGLPAGSRLVGRVGNPASAVLRWRPVAADAGDYVLVFTAQASSGAAAVRSIVVHVLAPVAAVVAPRRVRGSQVSRFVLSGRGNVWRWAPVVRRVVVRVAPSLGARSLGVLSTVTPEGTSNLVLALAGRVVGGRVWIRVRFPVLPNDRTGWVERGALGGLRVVRTHLVVDRARYLVTLYRAGRVVFRTGVGVGKPSTPTPAGEFYVREKLTSFSDPAYGPLAFGTSARSATLTDWPGGGFIGIHGTDQPQILPGGVSHGCIRLRNEAILRLGKLMPVGTPITIH